MEPRTLHILGKYFIIEFHPSSIFIGFIASPPYKAYKAALVLTLTWPMSVAGYLFPFKKRHLEDLRQHLLG